LFSIDPNGKRVKDWRKVVRKGVVRKGGQKARGKTREETREKILCAIRENPKIITAT
jgi:hypothetical protein